MIPSNSTILIPGSGPIVIGQGAEFDYSGTQAVKILKKLGYRVVLVNSNPATIMTDPELADATYIEPLTVDVLEAIIAQERPDYLLPTVGGQTSLNLAMQLAERGILAKYQVSLIGANVEAIRAAEDRNVFRETMLEAGLPVPDGGPVYNQAEAQRIVDRIGFPVLVRASFALGGSGASWVNKQDDLMNAVAKAIAVSPIGQAWIEESLLGWKEYELETMCDRLGNFVVICSIENIDPMGIHTGDSITVAPAQTLTDREYQLLRDLAQKVMRAIGVETGGANVQFAVDRKNGRVRIIEMNPRVSRSSALASKATGFPIAKIAALVAVGYTLDEIVNDITGVTKAAFEPSIDYVVVKFPRWAYEKFPGSDPNLGPQMKSVGEVMALGRTFAEAVNKAVQSLEIGIDSLDGSGPKKKPILFEASPVDIAALGTPDPDRLFRVYQALRAGYSLEVVSIHSGYDIWFVAQLEKIAIVEIELIANSTQWQVDPISLSHLIRNAKRMGLADSFISRLLNCSQEEFRKKRLSMGIRPSFLRVDTCAAEFEALTPYLYSCYEQGDEANPSDKQKILILGSGPNRIGQGIEFDYCCCQAVYAFSELGFETILFNCNPETVSTDYDTADRLYFEPLTLEHVLNVVDLERPAGVIVQFGGQTPLNLAAGLKQANVQIWGTPSESISLSEDREAFANLLQNLGIPQPEHGLALGILEAREIAHRIGFPLMVRPSFVLGGRAMAVIGIESQLEELVTEAMAVSPGQPVLIDRFLDDAYEIDIDAVGDGENVVVGAIMQHIEEAGVHSGDAACVIPPYKISSYHLNIMEDYTIQMGRALKVRGLMNVQFAIKDDVVYVLEVNPRASRTIPFASKAIGRSLVKIAAQILAGADLVSAKFEETPEVNGFFVKAPVLPFAKLPGFDPRLGPEMRSTGEVMGHASHFGHAFAKSQIAAGMALPVQGSVLISVNDFDKGSALKIGRDLQRMGFILFATPGTADFFRKAGLEVNQVNKAFQGSPHTVDLIRSGKIALILNTPFGINAHTDGVAIRAAAVSMGIPLVTTLSAGAAAVAGIRALRQRDLNYKSLQRHFLKHND